MIKVLIVDDQALIRESLKVILENQDEIEVVDIASNGKEALEKIALSVPDIVLMDIRMPIMDGVECTKIIKEKYPDTKIIVLTTFDDDEYVYNALKYGASGYLLKGVSTQELINSIEIVNSGKAMINPDIATKVVRLFSQIAKSDLTMGVREEDVENISKTEFKIIEQISYGSTNKEIANTLNLSEGTVRNYLSSILLKLGLRDRTQLAIWAVQSAIFTRIL